jgi:hypothetical protein
MNSVRTVHLPVPALFTYLHVGLLTELNTDDNVKLFTGGRNLTLPPPGKVAGGDVKLRLLPGGSVIFCSQNLRFEGKSSPSLNDARANCHS